MRSTIWIVAATLLLPLYVVSADGLVPLRPSGVNLNQRFQEVSELDEWEDLFSIFMYSDDQTEYYLISGSQYDTMCVVFQPLGACSIYVAQQQWYSGGTFQAFIWDYNEEASPNGQAPDRGTSPISPLGDLIFGPFYTGAQGTNDWEELFTPDDLPDGGIEWGDSMFVVGFVKNQDDGLPQPLADDVTFRRIAYTWFGGPWMQEYDYDWGSYSYDINNGTVIDMKMRVLVGYTENIPPIIYGLTPLPNTIDAGQICTVWCNIVDDNGWTTDFATLNISLNDGPPFAVEMTDPDGDDWFEGTINLSLAETQEGDVISYWVYAEDELGNWNSNENNQQYFTIRELVHPDDAEILLVVENLEARQNVIITYLENSGVIYELWDIDLNRGIDEYVISGGNWNTVMAGGFLGTWVPTREYGDDAISGWLMQPGHNFILSDMDYFWAQGEGEFPVFGPGDFAYDIFGIADGANDPQPTDSMFVGVAGDPISGDFMNNPYITYPHTVYPILGGDWADFVNPTETAESFFTGNLLGEFMAVRKEMGLHKTAYFAFDIFCSCIENEEENLIPTTQFTTLMDGLLDWVEPLTISIVPHNPPVIIPTAGGFFWYNVTIGNNSGQNVQGIAWLEAILPNGNVYGPILQVNLALAPGQSVHPTMNQNVPGWAPEGIYQYCLKYGDYPEYLAMDCLEFTKLPGDAMADMNEEWVISGWNINEDELLTDTAIQPISYAIEKVVPNPFNPTTKVTVSLPEASRLSIIVFNTLGQQVAVLASSNYNAGYHNFDFIGSDLASGIYFIQASVPGMMNQVRKVMLMK